MRKDDPREPAERGELGDAPDFKLIRREPVIIMVEGEPQRREGRHGRLHHDGPRRFRSASPPGHLGDQLKQSLISSKIGAHAGGVGVEDPDERNKGKIESFGDHLRADQRVDPLRFEVVNNPLIVPAVAHGVAVDPLKAHLCKPVAQQFLDFLGALSQLDQGLAAGDYRARRGRGHTRATMMADGHAGRGVQDKGDVAVRAFHVRFA